jgi:hypothetical protein
VRGWSIWVIGMTLEPLLLANSFCT